MLIDHIGLLYFQEQIIFRLLGRMSMPLFAFCIARGVRYTHNIKNYLFRILLIALVSQIPYMVMIREYKLNICFLWAISIGFIWACKAIKCPYRRLIVLCIFLIACTLIPMDYGLYGFLYVIILYCYAFEPNNIKMYGFWISLHIVKLIIDVNSGLMQIFTLPTISLINICNIYGFEKKIKRYKIFMWFYPIHIIVLLFLYVLFINIQ